MSRRVVCSYTEELMVIVVHVNKQMARTEGKGRDEEYTG